MRRPLSPSHYPLTDPVHSPTALSPVPSIPPPRHTPPSYCARPTVTCLDPLRRAHPSLSSHGPCHGRDVPWSRLLFIYRPPDRSLSFPFFPGQCIPDSKNLLPFVSVYLHRLASPRQQCTSLRCPCPILASGSAVVQ